MRKKHNLILSISVISMFLLTACGKAMDEIPEKITSVSETPSAEEISPIDTDEPVGIAASPEELKAAKESGYVIMEDGSVIGGKEKWLSFYEKVSEGEAADVRIVYIYTLDNVNCTEEYYEAEKDNYPTLFASELVYDGDGFTTSPLHYDGSGFSASYIEGYDSPPTTWKYLMRYTGKPSSATALFSDYDRYVLVNDNTVSWEDIEQGMYSSQLGDGIPFDEVFCELTWK